MPNSTDNSALDILPATTLASNILSNFSSCSAVIDIDAVIFPGVNSLCVGLP